MTDALAVPADTQPVHSPPPAPSRTADWCWSAYLLVFSFLLASFPARNTDVWANLTSGRDLCSGQLAGLSFTWLYDSGLYVLHAVGGDFLTVLAKTLAAGGVGVLLLRTGRNRRGWLVPVVCAGLAVLAISSRSLLRPHTVSYLFLALILWVQNRPRDSSPASASRLPWLAVGLFLLWANTDRGFLFGLVVVAVVEVGRTLDGAPAWKRLLPLGACAVAGLLNPAHLHGFPMPVEFGWVNDATARAALRSPFGNEYYSAAQTSPADLAYYPLLLLGLFGFVLNPRGFRWERFLPWVLTAVLSGITDRAIPLFAIVGGPIAARNLSDYFAHAEAARPTRTPKLVGVPLVAAAAVVFLIAAWPGLLLGPPYEPRRWAYDLPPAPAAVSDWIRRETAAGRWAADSKTLHLYPRSLGPFRWFCPDDTGVADKTITEVLVQGRPPDDMMRAAGCTRLLVYYPDRERLTDEDRAQLRLVLRVLMGDPYHWPLLHVGGDVAVFGWRDPADATDRFPGRGMDLTATVVPELEPSPVPTAGPPLSTPDWKAKVGEWFRTPVRTQSVHRDQAAMLLLLADSSADSVVWRNGQSWGFEQSAALTAAAAAHLNPLAAVTDAAVRYTYIYPPIPKDKPPPPISVAVERQFQGAQFNKDEVYAGLAYAAVRAARRATDDTPADPLAHVLLGEAYMLVRERTRERAWADLFPKLAELRQAQAAAALNRALELSPPPTLKVRVHSLLAKLYATSVFTDFTDLAIEQYELSKAPYPGRPPAPAVRGELENVYEVLAKDLKERQEVYAKDSGQKNLREKVLIARNLRLNRKALDLLLESDVSAFGDNGLKFELELLVRTGQPQKVLDYTEPDQRLAVGPQSYHWYRSLAMSARGDYADVDEELASIAGGVKAMTPDPAFLAQSVAYLVGKNVLGEAPTGAGVADAIRQTLSRAEAYGDIAEIEGRLKNLAEVSVLRGVLAAEAGDLDRARAMFRAAISFSPELEIGGGKPAGLVAQGMLTRLEPVGKR